MNEEGLVVVMAIKVRTSDPMATPETRSNGLVGVGVVW